MSNGTRFSEWQQIVDQLFQLQNESVDALSTWISNSYHDDFNKRVLDVAAILISNGKKMQRLIEQKEQYRDIEEEICQ